MSDDIKFKFDLDAGGALGEMEKMKSSLDSLAKGEQLMSMASRFTALLGPLGLVATAIFALKTSLDFAEEGEQIQKIEDQFNSLTTSAGISAQTLSEGINKSTKGLMTNADALKVASKAVVELGANSVRIPELMDQARLAARAMGISFQEAFDAMSTAIATGQTRQLRHIGLIIDQKKALIEYAQEQGVAVDTLTQFQKQQAIMNETLALSKEKFGGVSLGTNTMAGSTKSLSVAFGELNEQIGKIFAEKIAPKAAAATSWWANAIEDVALKLKSGSMKEGLEKNNLDIDILDKKIKELTKTYEYYSSDRAGHDEGMIKNSKELLDNALKEKESLEALANAQSEKAFTKVKAAAGGGGGESEAAKAARELAAAEKEKEDDDALVRETKFQQEITQIKINQNQQAMSLETDDAAHKAQMDQERLLAFETIKLKEKALDNEYFINASITDDEYDRKSKLLMEDRALKEKELKDKELAEDLAYYDNKLKHASTFGDGFAAGLNKEALTAKKAYQDMGGFGGAAFTGLGKGAVAMFKAMGAGSKDAAQLMKNALLTSLGDIAVKKGEFMMLDAFKTWPIVGFPELAAGAGLIALGGALGASGSSSSSSGSSSTSASPADLTPAAAATAPTPSPTAAGKAVTIQFSGSYFETEQTQRRLVDLIRQETDASSYAYQQVPVS